MSERRPAKWNRPSEELELIRELATATKAALRNWFEEPARGRLSPREDPGKKRAPH